MPARRQRRYSETHAPAAIAARVSFGGLARASYVRTIPPAPMRRLQWPIIWLELVETSRVRPRNRNLSGRPPMSSRSSLPLGLRSSRPSLESRRGLHLALRSHNPRVGQLPALRRARCLTRVRCRKHARFRMSGIPSRHCLHRRHYLRRRPPRCCSHSKSSERGEPATPSPLMASVQPPRAPRLPLPASRVRGELPRPPARRSARLRPPPQRPHHARP